MPPPRKTREFNTADLVFAKIKGYPPWPARIEELQAGFKSSVGRYPVFFFGTYETAVVAAKDLFPYDQYKHQFGIKRKMKNFNEGLQEIENTPSLTMDSENLMKIREERENQPQDANDEDDSASDASFQGSDNDNSSDSSKKSASDSDSDSSSSVGIKRSKKNGKSKAKLPNKKMKLKDSSDEKDSESDSEDIKLNVKTKNSKEKKNGSIKEKDNKSKGNFSKNKFLLKDDTETKSKARKRIKQSSDSEASNSAPPSDNDANSDQSNEGRREKTIISDDSDSEEKNIKKRSAKKSRINSDSESDSRDAAKDSPKDENLEDAIKLKQKLHKEKLAQKLEEKEREKERRKKEKMEQKRLERIKKSQEADCTTTAEGSLRTIGEMLTNVDQSIKSSLSINNANVEKCLHAMDTISDIKITSQAIASYSGHLKELIQTLKKCKKYKADQRIREKADLCLNKLKKLYMGESAEKSKNESPSAADVKGEQDDPNTPPIQEESSIAECSSANDSLVDDVEQKDNDSSSSPSNSTPLQDC